MARADSRQQVSTTTEPLDLVLFGAGVVTSGLPLSLALVDAGLRVGIYDIDVGAPRPYCPGVGEMPFMENGVDALLFSDPPRRVASASRLERVVLISRADNAHPRHRHPRR